MTKPNLANEMEQWELHALRTHVQAITLMVALHAHYHPEARDLLGEIIEANAEIGVKQLAALLNPVTRHNRDNPTAVGVPDVKP